MTILLPLSLGVFALALVHANWRSYWEMHDRVRRSEEHLALVHTGDLDRAGRRYGIRRLEGEGDANYRRRIAEARAKTLAV